MRGLPTSRVTLNVPRATLGLMLLLPLLLLAQVHYLVALQPAAPAPFQQYPAPDSITGKLAMPRLVTVDDRRYKDELEAAITKGYDVVDGGTEHERPGANFAGRYVLVQCGCGSDCMRAALIDGRDGSVIHLPQIPGETPAGFVLPTGSADMRTLEFRWNSTLIGIPRKADGMTYYFLLNGHHWRFLSKTKTPPDHA